MKTVQGTITLHVPEKYGAETGRQFEPETETHHFGFVVKVIDPGCTLEVQIEERSGRVSRITTTEDPFEDAMSIKTAVNEALDRLIEEMQLGVKI